MSIARVRVLSEVEPSRRGIADAAAAGRFDLPLKFHPVAIRASADIIGAVTRVVDGDTFWIGNTKVRTCGINAPERGQVGASEATAALTALVSGKTVRCVQVGNGTVCDGRSKPTNGDRIVAQCFVGDIDMGDSLVQRGLACDWVRFSGGYYSRNGGRRCK